MASCTVIIGCIDHFAHTDPFENAFNYIQRIFIGICVSDAYDLFFGFYDVVAYQIDQCIQRSFSPSTFLELNNVAVFVAAKDRFDT